MTTRRRDISAADGCFIDILLIIASIAIISIAYCHRL